VLSRVAPGQAHPVDLALLAESARSLEALPASLVRLAGLVADPDADLAPIVEVVTYDEALTANLLRRANSAVSASRSPIRSVHDAVVRLGMGTVLALAMSASLSTRMRRALPQYGLAEGELWEHSVTTSLAIDVLRARSSTTLPPEASTAGLLHDLGKLVLCRFLGPNVLEVVRTAATTEGLSWTAAEQRVLGVHHGALAGMIAEQWRLPPSIIAAVSRHHTPAEGPEDPIVWAVAAADVMAHGAAGASPTPHDLEVRRGACAVLGVPGEQWPAMVAEVGHRFQELRERYR
jgi:HD-like signal output (HDOD) protein